MAVTPSPFSKKANAVPKGYGFDEDGNPIYVKADGTIVRLAVGGKAGEKPKSSFAQEKNKLEMDANRLVATMASNPNLSFAEQKRAQDAVRTVAAGGKASVVEQGALGKLLGGLGSIAGKTVGKAFDVYQKAVEPFQSAGHSFTKELSDLMSGRGFSVDDLIAQSRMDNFKAGDAAGVENKWIRGIGNLTLDIIFDPTTYLTLGGSAAAKATRFALATRAAELVPKYPELKPLLSNIGRYGAIEIPKHIREAEGIAAGVKYMGKELPFTSGLAKSWRYSFAPVRATIGDVVASGKYGRYAMQRVTPKSLRPLTDVGFARKAAQNVYKPEFAMGLFEASANNMAKGIEGNWREKFIGMIASEMQQADELKDVDESIGQVYRAIESGSDDGLSDAAKVLYERYKQWSTDLRDTVVARQRKLKDDYGIAVSEMGFIEDHIFHKITPEAKAWISGADNVTLKSGFRSNKLTEREILESSGTMMYRKIRPPVVDEAGNVVSKSKFLGREVDDASIDGLNKISMEELGFKWFSDDLGSIAQGYAESMARAMGRMAYVDRAFAFGADVIQPAIIKSVVPNAELVTELTTIGSKLSAVEKALKARVRRQAGLAGTREGVAGATEDITTLLDNILQGRFMESTAIDDEIRAIESQLDDVFDIIEAARQKSLRVEGEARGEFNDLWGGYLRSAENLRSSLANNAHDREGLLLLLREQYVKLAGGIEDAAEMEGKSVEWFAERIKRMSNGGVSEPKEQARLLARQQQLRTTLDELPTGAANDATRQRIVGELDAIDKQLEAVRILGDVRANASYASDGVIWGSVPDATDAEAPFQMWTTKPVDDEYGTFRRMPDSLMGHAIPEEDLVDFRNPEMMQSLLSQDTIGDTVARVFREVGIEDPTWQTIVDGVMANNGIIDDTFRAVSPAKAEFLEGIQNFQRMVDDAVEQGIDLTSFEIESFFGWLRENFQAIAREYDTENIDGVANTMLHNFMRGITDDAVDNGFRGTLMPMRSLFPQLDDVSSEWAVLLPKDTPTPAVGSELVDEWQTVMDNPLADTILNGSQEGFELDLMARGDALRTEGLDLQRLQELRDGLEKELAGITNPTDDLVERAKAAQTVRYEGRDIPVAKARKQLAAMDKVLAREASNVDRQIDNLLRDEYGLVSSAETKRLTLEERLPIVLDNATAITNWDTTMGQTIRQELEALTLLLTRKPGKGSTAASNAAWVKQVEDTLRNSALLDFDPVLKDAFERVTGLVHLGEAELAKVQDEIAENAFKLSRAEAGEWGKYTFDKAIEGWDILESLGVQMPDVLTERWRPNLQKLRDTSEAHAMTKFIDGLQNYWKRYVTASVGFFVRNGMSGTFMNYADGVGLAEMREGLRWAFAQAESKGRRIKGKTYANWMARAGVTDEAEADLVMQIVMATGRGQTDDFALPAFGLEGPNGNIIKRASNAYLGMYSRKNDMVEAALRIPMALDSVRRGQSFDEAVARIRRVHFDYSDLSKLDEKMKRVIPFWIWTSRNVPLQVSQMMTRPKAYVQYERLKREFPVNSELMVPKWIQDYGPIGVAADMVLTPDMPQARLGQQLKQIATPGGLLANVTPLIRVPYEVWKGRKMQGDIPFSKNKAEAKGVERVVGKVVNAMLGTKYAEVDSETGKVMIDPRVTYVLEYVSPLLAQFFRVTGGEFGGKETLEDRGATAILNWFGIPLRPVKEKEQRQEAYGRNIKMGQLESELKKLIESKKPSRPNP